MDDKKQKEINELKRQVAKDLKEIEDMCLDLDNRGLDKSLSNIRKIATRLNIKY